MGKQPFIEQKETPDLGSLSLLYINLPFSSVIMPLGMQPGGKVEDKSQTIELV